MIRFTTVKEVAVLMKFFFCKSPKLLIIFLAVLSVFNSCSTDVQSDVHDVTGTVTLCRCGKDSIKLTLTSMEYGTVETVSTSDGKFAFRNVWKGTYTVTPQKEGYTFFPASREITVDDGAVDLVDFDTITSWENTYGPADKDAEAFSVVQTPDCGFLIAGYKNVSSTGTDNIDMWLIKTDLYGDIVWEDTFGDNTYPDIAYSAIFDSDGNIVAAGYSDSVGAGAINILKYVPAGPDYTSWVLTGGWQYYYGTELLPEKPAYIFQTTDSGYFTGGFSGGTAGNLEDIYGVKTDNSGVQISTFIYGIDDAEKSNAADMILRDPLYEGGVIIAGETKDSSDSTKALLLKRNNLYIDGWNRIYTAKDPSTSADCFFTSFNSVKETEDSGYICAGTVKRDSTATRDIYILKTDINGNEQWSRLIDCGADDFNCVVTLTSDGGYAVGATCMSLAGKNYNFYLFKLSSTGEIQWQREFDSGNDSDDFLRSIVQTYDGGFTLCGVKTSFNGKKQVFIIKTDKYGELPLKSAK